MKLDHLVSFKKVVETGSFTRAAQELFMTQPTVTHHIQALERELGCSLLVRSSQDTRLTAEGEELLQKVEELFRQLEDIRHIGLRTRHITGKLDIVACSVMGTYFLPPVLKALAAKYTDVSLHLRFGNSHTIAALVQDGLVDIGFAPWVPGFPSLNFTLARAESSVIVASKNYFAAHREALVAGDFSGEQFILREKGTRIHEIAMSWLKKYSLRPLNRTVIISDDMESIKNLVLCNAGLAIIPRCCVEQCLEMGTMVIVSSLTEIPDVEYFIVQRNNEPVPPLISVLLEELQGVYPDIELRSAMHIS